MKTIYPDYYNDFKCIADKCKHNCCIGWEIDIDEQSLPFYESVKGEFGKKLKAGISYEGTPHFILSENERCPFLNQKNLCDIYTNLGKESLCQICKEHPRFYNELDDSIEAGLGLCCEEAARLIITKKDPVKLIGEASNLQGLPLLREKVFEELQNRDISVSERIINVFSLFEESVISFDILMWAEIFESLERLDESWTKLLTTLKTNYKKADQNTFAKFIKPRETEYEQFLVYLIYRHTPKAEFYEDFMLYTIFSVLSFELIYAMGAVAFSQKGDFSTQDQLEIMRLFSSEIEYSDQNLDIILNELEKVVFGY